MNCLYCGFPTRVSGKMMIVVDGVNWCTTVETSIKESGWMTNNVCIVLLSSFSFIFNNTSSVIVLWIWVHGRKFTLPFCFVLLCIWGHCFQVQAPGGLYLEGRFNGGFFALRFWGAYFRNFTVIDNPDPVGWITKTFSALASFSNSFRWICFGLLSLKRFKTKLTHTPQQSTSSQISRPLLHEK